MLGWRNSSFVVHRPGGGHRAQERPAAAGDGRIEAAREHAAGEIGQRRNRIAKRPPKATAAGCLRPLPACLAGERVLLAKERTFLRSLDPCRLVRQVKESWWQDPAPKDLFTCQASWQGSEKIRETPLRLQDLFTCRASRQGSVYYYRYYHSSVFSRD